MHDLLSPKQVAQALKVSESSVKRWCDKGCIATTYTEGGHRRIRLSDLAEFIRSKSLRVIDFTPIGFQSSSDVLPDLGSARNLMTESLLNGDENRCVQIVFEMYFAKQSVHAICDLVIAAAFHEIGHRWACGQAEIYQERRGCKIAQRILNRLHGMLPSASPNCPLALGCSTEGDNYSMASTMAELVLCEAGWRAVALGENLPLISLGSAIAHHRPAMVWVSCSHIADADQFVSEFKAVYDEYHRGIAFVIGGRALTESLLTRLPPTVYCRSMSDLYEFATKQLAKVA